MAVDAGRRQEALEAVVRRLLEIAPPNAAEVYAGFQAPASDTEHYGAVVGAVNLGDRWGFGQFDQDPVLFDLVREFWEASDDRWTTCEIKARPEGDFDVQLGYAPLPDGQVMDPGVVDRLQSYGDTFVAAHGAAPS